MRPSLEPIMNKLLLFLRAIGLIIMIAIVAAVIVLLVSVTVLAVVDQISFCGQYVNATLLETPARCIAR